MDFSVIIPNYNKGVFLEECICSVFNQSVLPKEVIVVDDCSTDNSIEILELLSNKYQNLKVIKLKENCGVSNARNVGIQNCNTELITFLDSDDFNVNIDKYKNELAILEKSSCNTLVYSEIVKADINGKIIDSKKHIHSLNMSGNCTLKCILFKGFFYGPFDYMVPTSLVKRVGGYSFDKNLYEDLDLLIRLSFVCEFKCTNKIGRAYRYTPNGLSKAKQDEHKEVLKSFYCLYYPRLSLGTRIYGWFLKFFIKLRTKFYKDVIG